MRHDRNSNAGSAEGSYYTADQLEDMQLHDSLPKPFRDALNEAPLKFSAKQIIELRQQMADAPLLKAIRNGR